MDPFVSERELLGIVAEAAQDEVIEHEERELIESIIEFGDTVAREVMVPRPDMIIVPEDATISAALDLAIEHGVSRLPLHGPDGDDIVGLLYTKDLIGAERAGRGAEVVTDLCRPVRFIPENKPVARLMREMQAGKFHLAIVADEYGGIAGLITLEDCLEELVGEIVDEYDVEELSIQQLPGGDYLVEGGVQVEELNDVLDADLPDEEWDTVGGLLFGTLEHVPEPGESVELDGWRFTAEELDGRRIRSVRVERSARPAPTARMATAPEPAGTFAGHGDLPRRQGRTRHRRLARHRQGHRRGFAGAGAKVMLSSRKREGLEAAASEMSGDVDIFPAHVGKVADAEACVDATIERFGGLDILVNNAGANPYYGATMEVDEARYDKTFEVNLRGPVFWSAQAVAKAMKEKPGVIINIASVGGLRSEFGLGVYNVTKAALIHLTRQLAGELGPTRVVGIAPGLVKTDFAAYLVENFGDELARRMPTRRLGEPEDIANLAVFLASDKASWITGETYVIDGGAGVAQTR